MKLIICHYDIMCRRYARWASCQSLHSHQVSCVLFGFFVQSGNTNIQYDSKTMLNKLALFLQGISLKMDRQNNTTIEYWYFVTMKIIAFQHFFHNLSCPINIFDPLDGQLSPDGIATLRNVPKVVVLSCSQQRAQESTTKPPLVERLTSSFWFCFLFFLEKRGKSLFPHWYNQFIFMELALSWNPGFN